MLIKDQVTGDDKQKPLEVIILPDEFPRLPELNIESDYLEEDYRKRLKTARYAYQDIIKSVIENGMESGVFRKTNADLMTRLLINSIISIIYTSRPSASPEKMLDETMDIFLHGIMNDGDELL